MSKHDFNDYVKHTKENIKENIEKLKNHYSILLLVSLIDTKFVLKDKTLVLEGSSFNIKKLKESEKDLKTILSDLIISFNIDTIEYEILAYQEVTDDNHIVKHTKPKNIVFYQDGSLNLGYTFTNYLVDTTNYSAFTTIKNIVDGEYESTGGKIITLYGFTGVGKTHLVSAMLNSFSEKYEGKKAYYFVKNYWVELIKRYSAERKLEALLNELSKANIVVIDDLSFICDTNRAVYIQMIYDLLNLRVSSDKITVITTPVKPNQIKFKKDFGDSATGSYFEKKDNQTIYLSAPFLSRLLGNMIVIEEPSYDLKLSYVKRTFKYLLQIDYFELNENTQKIIELLISAKKGDFRFLKGMMEELLNIYSLSNNIDSAVIDLAKIMGLGEQIKEKNNNRLNYIVGKMCDSLDIKLQDIQNKISRYEKEKKFYRDAIIYVLNKYHDFSFQTLSSIFNISKVSCHLGYKSFEKDLKNKENQDVMDQLLKI